MKLLAETILFELPCYLSEKDVKYWASMTRWFRTEAVMLSLGLDPRRTGDSKVSNKEASRLRKEFNDRDYLLEEEVELDQQERYQYSKHETLYDPERFVVWAKAKFSSFPESLFFAVNNNITPCKHNVDKSDTESKGNPGSDARWSVKREIVNKAEEFVKKSLEDGCEYCDHCQLADYMYQMLPTTRAIHFSHIQMWMSPQ